MDEILLRTLTHDCIIAIRVCKAFALQKLFDNLDLRENNLPRLEVTFNVTKAGYNPTVGLFHARNMVGIGG